MGGRSHGSRQTGRTQPAETDAGTWPGNLRRPAAGSRGTPEVNQIGPAPVVILTTSGACPRRYFSLPLRSSCPATQKWATIKHKKGALDAKRGKIFTRLLREMQSPQRAAATLTAMPGSAPQFWLPKAENMPQENIKRAIRVVPANWKA